MSEPIRRRGLGVQIITGYEQYSVKILKARLSCPDCYSYDIIDATYREAIYAYYLCGNCGIHFSYGGELT